MKKYFLFFVVLLLVMLAIECGEPKEESLNIKTKRGIGVKSEAKAELIDKRLEVRAKGRVGAKAEVYIKLDSMR